MNQYEVMYILDASLEDQARTDLINRFSGVVTANGGTIDRVDEWGKRRLAYTIDYKTEGYYVLMYITAPHDLPRELERNMQISDSVIRYLVIRFEGELPVKREAQRPFVQNAAPKAEPVAPVAPAAAEPVAEEAAAVAQEAPAEAAATEEAAAEPVATEKVVGEEAAAEPAAEEAKPETETTQE